MGFELLFIFIDIEEDLVQLGGKVKIDDDPLAKANERIRQLEEMVEMFK